MRDQGQAMVTCEWCGKRFMDDCGDAFCSSSCERQWEEDQLEECDNCGGKFDEHSIKDGLCENCWDEEHGYEEDEE